MDDQTEAKTAPQGYAVIHGHFYQPPRENPWIEEIETEPSARPFRDWNTRITAECYTPNSCARIYDGPGRILDIVNNYEFISFNIGPTLMSWLEVHAPLTYRRVLDADRKSGARLGHGNAIAQAYNHAILPLLTPRDRETQIIWGLRDFEYRFGRRAEAMWLPETAVNYPTLAALVAQGMKFVILSPYQAKRVRPLTGGSWQEAQAQTLDTTQAYRCFIPEMAAGDPSQRTYIDVFFYNGEVASDLSFGDLLRDSYRLSDRLTEAFDPDKKRPQLLHVATDGENYGHHKKFGELSLAHALTQVLPQSGFPVTNYAAFLELVPPKMMVELALGEKGEGSSWSCAHGVGRWQEDCGCSTGGPANWQQKWRAPLKHAFDFLNKQLAVIFEQEGAGYFRDPWAARTAYITLILNREPESVEAFFAQEGRPGLAREDWVSALRLLEMQRHALLMYTSCGWFFADLAGLETLQVLKYGARALQLGQYFSQEPIESAFVDRLEEASSNIPTEGNGRQIYERRIKPAVVDFGKIVNHWVISWLKNRGRQCPARVYHFRVESLEHDVKSQASIDLAAGRLRLTSGITLAVRNLAFFTAYLGSYLYRTQVKRELDRPKFASLQQELFAVLESAPENLIPLMAKRLGEDYLTVHDVFQEEKEGIFRDLLNPNQEEAVGAISHHFNEAKSLLKAMAHEGLPMPRLYQALGEISLNRKLVEVLRGLEPVPEKLNESEELLELIQDAALLGLKLQSGEGAHILQHILTYHLMDLTAELSEKTVQDMHKFLGLVRRMPISLELTEAQNFFFTLMQEQFPSLAARSGRDPQAVTLARTLIQLAEALFFNPEKYAGLLG
jgi:alpha-amylase/alpha-mannosidase (GH57 family)